MKFLDRRRYVNRNGQWTTVALAPRSRWALVRTCTNAGVSPCSTPRRHRRPPLACAPPSLPSVKCPYSTRNLILLVSMFSSLYLHSTIVKSVGQKYVRESKMLLNIVSCKAAYIKQFTTHPFSVKPHITHDKVPLIFCLSHYSLKNHYEHDIANLCPLYSLRIYPI